MREVAKQKCVATLFVFKCSPLHGQTRCYKCGGVVRVEAKPIFKDNWFKRLVLKWIGKL